MDRWKSIALVLGGVLVGMLVGPPGATTAEAPTQFSECVSYCGFISVPSRASRLETERRPVPAGWSVVSGYDGNCAFLCR